MELREARAGYLVEAGQRVPKGYKQTEVGVIPEDWCVQLLGAITDPNRPISYGIVQTGPSISNGVKCLRVLDIEDGRINKTDLITTTKAISNSYKRTILKAGDLVTPLRGKVGDVALVDEDLAGSNLTRGVALIAIRSDWSAPFCKQVISFAETRSRLENSMNGSALQEVPIATLRAFKISLPPTKAEQEAIAEALSDADALIESLEQLIAKKRHIKQGAMQELLTGKKRLPGFSGEWEVKRLGDLLDYEQPTKYLVKDSEYNDGNDVPVLTAGKTFILGYTHEENGIFNNLPVIIFDDFTTANKYVTFPFKAKSSAMKILKPRDATVNLRLVFEAMQLIKFQLGDHKRYWISEYQKLEVKIPNAGEQTAIAAILSDMDAEIAALEEKLAKTRTLKQGMMHELLTGKIRLI